MELIFLLVGAVFLILKYEKNVDNTLMFLVVAEKSRIFFSSHVWLMSRRTRAGREHSQAVSPNVPYTDVMLSI